LVSWRERSFVAHCVERALDVGAEPVVVVEGAVELAEVIESPARLVHNEQWHDGPLSSLQTGLGEVPVGAHVLVLTVDRPHVGAATVAALVDAARSDPASIWQPRHEGTRGHPILYPPDVVQALLTLARTDTARTLLARPEVAARRRTVDVDDRAVLENLDRPEDLASLPK
jgi:CTP:molybdopterin cytidylyltransferase MocA